MVKVVTSPIPETGCGCGAQVPFRRPVAHHHHQLTIAEVEDFRGLHPHSHAIVPASSSAAPVFLSRFASSAAPPPPPPLQQQQPEEPTPFLGSSVPLIRSKTCPTNSSNPPLVISKATMSPRRSSTPPPLGGGHSSHEQHQQTVASPSSRYTTGASPLSLECDYDVRPTELYKSIQSKQWDRVLELLESDNAIQASIWVVRKEPSGQLRWRLLPLHAALIFQAPYNVIEALLGVYPAAAAAKDDQGMLPLHLALRNAPIEWAVVEELLTAHPGAVGTQDRKGRTPLQGATTRNNDPALGVLKLYTQIAVARERSIATSGAGGGDDSSVASSSHLQLTKLLELQQQVEHEREMWKQQIQAIESAALERVRVAESKRDELQEQVTVLQAQQAMAAAASPTPHEETEIWKELCLRLIQQQEQALDLSWLQTVVQTQQQRNGELKAELDDVQEQARAMMIMTPDTELRKEDILTAKSRARSYTPAFKITVESNESSGTSGAEQQATSMRVRMVEEKKEMSPLDRISNGRSLRDV